MAAICEHSARQHHAHVSVECTSREPVSKLGDAFVRKALSWVQAITDAPDGSSLALLDVDTIVQAPLDAAFSRPFDLAVCTRNGRLDTLNSGVLFVRPSDRVRRFLAEWPERTKPFCRRNDEIGKGRYGDQDALIRMLAEPHDLRVHQLPMAVWNCQQHYWTQHDRAKVVHFKSDARRIVVKRRFAPQQPGAAEIAQLWLQWRDRLPIPLLLRQMGLVPHRI